jgi:DNA-binding Lrp family transcriptional regulator
MRKKKKMRQSILDNTQIFSVDKNAEAIVLFTTAPGEEEKVIQNLKQIEATKEIYSIHGTYDILAKFKTTTYDCLKELLKIRINKIKGIRGKRILIVT